MGHRDLPSLGMLDEGILDLGSSGINLDRIMDRITDSAGLSRGLCMSGIGLPCGARMAQRGGKSASRATLTLATRLLVGVQPEQISDTLRWIKQNNPATQHNPHPALRQPR